jgi:hypothetical protein
MEFSSGVVGGEAPVDDGLGLVTLSDQGLDFPIESILAGKPLPETATGQDAELDLRHSLPRT